MALRDILRRARERQQQLTQGAQQAQAQLIQQARTVQSRVNPVVQQIQRGYQQAPTNPRNIRQTIQTMQRGAQISTPQRIQQIPQTLQRGYQQTNVGVGRINPVSLARGTGAVGRGLFNALSIQNDIKSVDEVNQKRFQAAKLGQTYNPSIDEQISNAAVALSMFPGAGITSKAGKGATSITGKLLKKLPSTQPIKVNKVVESALEKTANSKQRGFAESLGDSEEIVSTIKSTLKDIRYTPITNKSVISKAEAALKTTPISDLIDEVKTSPATAENLAKAQILIRELQNKGDFSRALDIIEQVSEQGTTLGQGVQSLSLFSRLTPEGITQYADRTFKRANREFGTNLKLDENLAKNLVDRAKNLQKLPEGRDKTVETALMLKQITDKLPTDILTKIGTAQTIAQLLNPKTLIRNIIGNTGLNVAENISDVVATPIDMATGLVTGKRTKAFPSIMEQFRGGLRGGAEAVQDVQLGIDTAPNIKSQFDLPSRPVFSSQAGKYLEKAMNYGLRVPDRAFYTAAFDESLRQQMKAAKVLEPTQEMLEAANFDGLYRTLQDENNVTKFFSGFKRLLNANQGFGAGDILLKYPKTPANLLNRGLAYSPAGFLKSLYILSRPLLTSKPFNQKQFVEATSRALAGTTGLVGTGALLNQLGIITGEPSQSANVRGAQEASGLGSYKINISALKRLAKTGFLDTKSAKRKDGDIFISYDWLQPAAIGLSIGANINQNRGKKGAWTDASLNLLESLQSGTNSLAETTLLRELTDTLGNYQGIGAAAQSLAVDAPASFVPTFLNQVRQLTDNIKRETADINPFKQSLKKVLNRVPVASSLLSPQRTVTGEEKVYNKDQDKASRFITRPLNVFLNPAFITKFDDNPIAQYSLALYENTGETEHLPRKIPRKVKVGDKDVRLSDAQLSAYQELSGKGAVVIYSQALQNEDFRNATPEEQSKEIAKYIEDLNTGLKIVLLKYNPKKVDANTKAMIQDVVIPLLPALKDNTAKNSISKWLQSESAVRDSTQ